MNRLLTPTATIDSAHPRIVEFARRAVADTKDDRESAVVLYYATRDGIRYDPYTVGNDRESLRASTTLAAGRGWCVPKAILLAAACRAVGIPARLGFADVRNHLSTKRMRASMGTDVFYWHGYASIQLDGKWLKATPAFNVELCEKFRLRPLEFDGREDSIYHPYDLEGQRHMEYVRDRGEYDDIPFDAMMATFREHYDPSAQSEGFAGDFDREVEEESQEP